MVDATTNEQSGRENRAENRAEANSKLQPPGNGGTQLPAGAHPAPADDGATPSTSLCGSIPTSGNTSS